MDKILDLRALCFLDRTFATLHWFSNLETGCAVFSVFDQGTDDSLLVGFGAKTWGSATKNEK